jgi:DNA helicase-2/ATP-dependent DNA helicase PcrA
MVLHVLAGPGTGKTFAMMRRVARLLEEGVAPERILVCSFTRTAARDLREQLERLAIPGADQVRATTLHSLCFSILASEQAFAFTNRTARPLMSYEQQCLIADLAVRHGGKRAVKKLVAAYEAAWARLQRDEAGFAQTPEDLSFERDLLAWLRFYEAMLIGELVPLAIGFVRANPARNALPEFDHVLVDEYQDLNKSDQDLVRRLAESCALLVIGDDNQSIYRFRYANPEGIRTFPADVPGAMEYRITESRRCPDNIVSISNALISHDPHTTRPSPLQPSHDGTAADVCVVQYDDLQDEIESVADYIDKYLTEHPDVPPGRMLVLATRKFIGNAIKDALIARGRNALSYFHEDAVSPAEAAEGFCLLTLSINPGDRAALRAWLGLGADDCRKAGVARVRAYCEQNEVGLPDALEQMILGTLTLPYMTPILERYRLLQQRLAALDSLTGLELVDALWPDTGSNVTDIRQLAAGIAYRIPEPAGLLDEMRTAITQPELPGSDGDIVQVMSLHKSKGLTRDVVFVVGCMAGALPSVDAADPPEVRAAQYEEQRRLFYVAITRATQILVISSAIRLKYADAKRNGAEVGQTIFIAGEKYALTAFTPFIREMGTSLPRPIKGSIWRSRVGLDQARGLTRGSSRLA